MMEYRASMQARALRASLALSLALLVSLFLLRPSPAAASRAAAAIQVFGLVQQDLDGDGLPDVTAIDCSFATERDQVLVFDRHGNMQAGSRWEETTDFADDVWVYDAGADGSAQLIITFGEEDGNQAAHLYVDENGDGWVAYELVGKQIAITEWPHWRMKVVARGDWLLPDGRPNPHLTMYVDGAVTRLLEWYIALAKWSWAPKYLQTDGKVDWEIESGDQDADGQADYVLTRLLTHIPDYFSAFRCSLYVDKNPRRTLPYETAVFWPFLVGTQGDDAALYFDRPPVIAMNWETASIVRAGIGGYPAEQGYHILSSAPTWQKGQVNDVLWENPLAYYNMAEDQDNWPELLIRVMHPIWLDAIPGRPQSPDMMQVEYNWDQDNNGRWDYELSVAGLKPITQTIAFPDFAVRTVPYEQLPTWATRQAWDAAFFLVGEAGGRGDSESLWVWDYISGFPHDVKSTYLAGYWDAPPPGTFQDIAVGYRGEYSLDYLREPLLYFSPADQRLHLWEAKEGVWKLDEGHYIRYANLDGDAYLDQWQESRDGAVVQQMGYSDGIYVLGGDGGVRV
ncbi:MAG: hypothetical protein GX604_09065, partial [Actinobacteria bacterium]|nr:hypothetical protein [Actinomycetota bacterium]